MTKPKVRHIRQALRKTKYRHPAEPPQSFIHFFDLPLEIRHIIYNETLPSYPIHLAGCCRPSYRSDFVPYCERTHCQRAPAVLRSNKRMRDEVLRMLEGQPVHLTINTLGHVLSNLPCFFSVDLSKVPRIVLEICTFSPFLHYLTPKWESMLSLVMALRTLPQLQNLKVLFKCTFQDYHQCTVLNGWFEPRMAKNETVMLSSPLLLLGNTSKADLVVTDEIYTTRHGVDEELQDYAARIQQRLRNRTQPSAAQIHTVWKIDRELDHSDRNDRGTPRMLLESPSTVVHALLRDHSFPRRSRGARLEMRRVDEGKGIRSQCRVCGVQVASRTKLFGHLRLWHPEAGLGMVGGREGRRRGERVRWLEMVGIL